MQNEALLLLVGDWIDSADCSLVDRIVFGLLPFLVLNQRSKAVAIPMLRTISGSVLASKHVLLHGMKNFVKRKGKIFICMHVSSSSLEKMDSVFLMLRNNIKIVDWTVTSYSKLKLFSFADSKNKYFDKIKK